MKLYTISQAAKFLNINVMTLHNWSKKNIVKHTTLPNGYRRYSEENLLEALKIYKKPEKIVKKNIIYSRVSTSIQIENLNRQKQRLLDYCAKNGIQISDVLSDVASGMNFNRVNFKKLINLILSNQVEYVIIEYKDRLLRFGFELFEHMCSYYNTKIIIINNSETLDYRTEITNDMISIIHHFCMKLYGSRKSKIKIKEIQKSIKNENLSS
jgi:predicted site-specific integrase-resolvase